jgi:hypothetical protein
MEHTDASAAFHAAIIVRFQVGRVSAAIRIRNEVAQQVGLRLIIEEAGRSLFTSVVGKFMYPQF